MPSEARAASVHCLMVRDSIPVNLCEAEQHSDACRGCTAATRYCAKCGMQNGIADAEEGICGKCLGTNIENTDDANKQEKLASFEDALQMASKIGRLKMPPAQAVTSAKNPIQIGASPLVKEQTTLYHLLMQHAKERNGAWTASAPVTILMRRAHLLRAECQEALSRLAKNGFLAGENPWDTVTLLKTEGLEELKENIETVTGRTRGKPATKSRRQKYARTVQNTLSVGSHPHITSGGWGAHKHLNLEPQRKKVTYREIAEFLKNRAVNVNGERLVPGVVPTTQIQFHLRMPDILVILRELEKSGFLGQKDEWRTVVILNEDALPAEADDQSTSNQSSIEELAKEEMQEKHKTIEVVVPTPAASSPSASQLPRVAQPSPRRAAALPRPALKPIGPTYAEMYAFLVQKSAEVNGERRTGGSLPQLQIRFKISVSDATTAMEWFAANGHVAKRDGWRTVALLSKAIGSTDSLKTAASKLPAKSGGKQHTATTVKTSVSSAQHSVPSGTDSIKTTLDALRQDTAALRGQQGEISQKFAELEAMIAKSLQGPRNAESAPQSTSKKDGEERSTKGTRRPSKGRSISTHTEGSYRMDKVKLTNHIREFRLEKNLTQEKLAKVVGISRQTICSLERGDQIPSADLVLCIARQLDCSVEQLFELRPRSSLRRK